MGKFDKLYVTIDWMNLDEVFIRAASSFGNRLEGVEEEKKKYTPEEWKLAEKIANKESMSGEGIPGLSHAQKAREELQQGR